MAIQELRDEEVVQRTLSILEARGHVYHAMVSPPVGRGVKERYAFLWRPEKVAPVDSGTVYSDPDDVFIMESTNLKWSFLFNFNFKFKLGLNQETTSYCFVRGKRDVPFTYVGILLSSQ